MFGRTKKKTSEIDPKQAALFEHAQIRIKEKSNFYNHFMFYLVGCLFMVVLNMLLNFGDNYTFFGLDWFVYGVLIWTFFILIHAAKVFLFSPFMGKTWEKEQMNVLVEKQRQKIAEMEAKLHLEIPKEAVSTKNVLLDNTNEITNDTPKLN